MDSKEILGLMEAYSDVYAPKENEEQLDEIAPLVAGGLALGGAALAGKAIADRISANRKKVTSPTSTPSGTAAKPSLSDTMQRRNQQMRSLMQSYAMDGELVNEVFESISYLLISQGYTAIDVLEYFAYIDENAIVEDFINLLDGTLIAESLVSDEYIEEQMQQLDEVAGALLRIGGAALKASRFAPRGAGIGQRAMSALGGAGRAAQRISQQGVRASSVVRPALRRAAQGVRKAGSEVASRVGGAVSKIKGAARGALDKLPGGSGGTLARAGKFAAKAALGGAAFDAGMRGAGVLASKLSGGQQKPPTAKPQQQNLRGLSVGQGGFRIDNKPVSTSPRSTSSATSTSRSTGGTAPTPRPSAAPATRSSGGAPTRDTPLWGPGSSATKPPLAKPSTSTATTKPATPPSAQPKIKQDVSDIKKMQTASQIRQKPGAPAITSSQIGDKSVAAPTTSRPQTSAKPTPTPTRRPGGSVKPGSLVSGFDMFDVVKGYLIDEGYAETEESAIAIMANMSEEWKLEIIDEAVKGESSDRRRALAAERRKGIKPLSAKEGEKYASHKISQMAYTKRAKMSDDD